MTFGAVLLSLFMPVIAVVVALVMRANELRPTRRQFLKNWAIASGVWLATGWLIGLIVFASAVSSADSCKGGINLAIPPSYQSSDGTHWIGTYTCMNGGTTSSSVPSSDVPGGAAP